MPSAEWDSFVYLYHCGVTGIAPKTPEQKIDGEKLLELADRQAATGVIACALRQNPSGYLTPEQALRLRMEAASKNLTNRARMEAALEVIDALQAAGIRPVVLKGMSQGVLYKYPESRSSADTDILVSAEQEEAALEHLKRLGFQIEPREDDAKDTHCIHPSAGLFEVHIRLFDKEPARALGRTGGPKLATVFTNETLWDHTLVTMEPNQNLLYLTLHLILHVVMDGIGFRVFYDTALYFCHHKGEIDPAPYWNELRRIGVDAFVNTALSMLVRAGCFSEDDFPGMSMQPEEPCTALANDIEAYNYGAEVKLDFATIYAFRDQQNKKLAGSLLAAHKKWERSEHRRILFPSTELLSQRYPALQHHRWLYPAFWAHRATMGVLDPKRRHVMEDLTPNHEQPKFGTNGRQNLERSNVLRQIGLMQKHS